MDYRSLSNVLGILRLVHQAETSLTGAQLVQRWAGKPVSDAGILRVACYVVDQVEEARDVIENSSLAAEAKHGVIEALEQVGRAFAIGGIHNQPKAVIKNVPGAIANLVILLSASGIETQPKEPVEALDLAKEIETLISGFDDSALDPIVREIAKQHLQILATLLRHVPIFGLEPALSAYFELVIKVRRADANTTPEQKDAAEPLMKKIDGWQAKLSALDKLWNQGARWIARGKSAGTLLGFIGTSAS